MGTNQKPQTDNATAPATAVRPLPAGFEQSDAVQMNERVDTVDKALLVDGAVVRFVRTDKWETNGEKFTMHVFQGKRMFGVWGAAQLDAKLERISPNTELFLRYEGKTQHPTVPTRMVHNWTVIPKRVQMPAAPSATSATVNPDDLPF